MQETQVRSLGGGDPLEGAASPSAIAAGESHGQKEPGGCSPRGRTQRHATARLNDNFIVLRG